MPRSTGCLPSADGRAWSCLTCRGGHLPDRARPLALCAPDVESPSGPRVPTRLTTTDSRFPCGTPFRLGQMGAGAQRTRAWAHCMVKACAATVESQAPVPATISRPASMVWATSALCVAVVLPTMPSTRLRATTGPASRHRMRTRLASERGGVPLGIACTATAITVSPDESSLRAMALALIVLPHGPTRRTRFSRYAARRWNIGESASASGERRQGPRAAR